MRGLTGLLAGLGLCTASMAPAQTVILVRHAEKAATPAADPPLTLAGAKRADVLAEALRGARLTAILTSTLARTRDTAAPVAKQAGLAIVPVPIGGDTFAHVTDVVARIGALPKNAVVLVVGHTNTIPAIAAKLGAGVPVVIPDCRYDGMTVLTLGQTPPAQIVTRYGAPSANCGG